MNPLHTLCLTLALLAGLSNTGYAQERVTGSTIVLGQSAPATGPAAQLGIQMNRGMKLHFDQVNAAGGINGRKIELRFLDDGYEPARTAANTKQLIDSSFALIGYVGTPTSAAALPAIVASEIPFFAPFTGAAILRNPIQPNVFHMRAGYDEETAEIVKKFTALGLNRVAVFHQNDSYGRAGLDGVNKALAAKGMQLVGSATVERNSVDVNSALAKLLPLKADVIVQIGAYAGCAAFIKQARARGFAGQFYNVSFVGSAALAKELGADGAGVGITQVVPMPYGSASPIALEFNNALKAAGQTDPNYSAMEGYIAAKVMTEALRRAGRDLTRPKLITALQSLREYSVGGFIVDFSPTKHVGSRFVELTMITRDGRIVR